MAKLFNITHKTKKIQKKNIIKLLVGLMRKENFIPTSIGQDSK